MSPSMSFVLSGTSRLLTFTTALPLSHSEPRSSLTPCCLPCGVYNESERRVMSATDLPINRPRTSTTTWQIEASTRKSI